MKAGILSEPELEFLRGRHIDIRAGLADFGPLDGEGQTSPKRIRVGLVGTSRTVADAERWLSVIRGGPSLPT